MGGKLGTCLGQKTGLQGLESSRSPDILSLISQMAFDIFHIGDKEQEECPVPRRRKEMPGKRLRAVCEVDDGRGGRTR